MTGRWVVVGAALGPLVLAVLALTAWTTGLLRLASVRVEYIPMAPSTAIGFLSTGAALMVISLAHGAAARRGALAAAVVVSLLAAINLTMFLTGSTALNLERILVAQPGSFGDVPLARMSPLTAVEFLLAGAGLTCLAGSPTRRARDFGSAAGMLVAVAGATVVLGYVYRAPLLYGGRVIPMALTTGLAFVGTGIALVAAAGPASTVLGPFCGGTAHARLLRLFLPLTVGAVLLHGIVTNVLLSNVPANPALLAALLALVSAIVVGTAVSWIARSLGGTIDRAQVVLEQSRDELERRVSERTAELSALNTELESFSYSVSHDLRAPLRHVLGFAAVLKEESGAGLDEQGRRHLTKITDAATRAGRLIDDLLQLSRNARAAVQKQPTSLAALVHDAQAEVSTPVASRQIAWQVQDPLPTLFVDPGLFRLVLVNLLSNAVKYTGKRPVASIEVGASGVVNGEITMFVRDNGAGFDMKYADKLFGVFQRLHSPADFEGTGIGLANVSRIVARHGGRVWAESAVGAGATFYVAVPV